MSYAQKIEELIAERDELRADIERLRAVLAEINAKAGQPEVVYSLSKAALAAPPAQPAQPAQRLTDEQIDAIAGQHGTTYRNRNFPTQPAFSFSNGSLHRFVRAIEAAIAAPPAQPAQRLTDEQIDAITRDKFGTKLLGVQMVVYREYSRAIEAALIPQGWVVVEADELRNMARDIDQHIGQGVESERLEAERRPGYGTGIYTYLSHQTQKLRDIAAAPKD